MELLKQIKWTKVLIASLFVLTSVVIGFQFWLIQSLAESLFMLLSMIGFTSPV